MFLRCSSAGDSEHVMRREIPLPSELLGSLEPSEHFTRNEGVSGSIPLVGSSRLVRDTKIQRRRRKIIESVDLPSLGIDLTNEELLQGVRKEQKKDLEEIRE